MINNTLIFSDLHAHIWKKFGLSKDGRISRRLQEQSDILDQIRVIIKNRKITRVIFAGDLYHKVGEIPVEALNIVLTFFNWLKEQNIEVLFVDGNHDLVNRNNPEWFESSVNMFKNKNCPENIRLVSFDEEINYDEIKGYDLVILHKTPIGSKVGNYLFEDGVNWKTLAANNKYVFFGHIHQRQQLSENCYVIGSPMHLTFGDIGDRGVYILDGQKPEFIKLKYPEFITVDTSDEVPWDDYENYYRVLKAEKKSENVNVVSVIEPKYFEERIKATNFQDILSEWLTLNSKDATYLLPLKEIIQEKTQAAKVVFKGKLSGVAIQNFISIGEAKYKPPRGLVLIKGINEDLDSNGAGKTSLLEAIYWCLYGKTTKGLTGDDVIRRGEKDCKVMVGLVDGDNKIRVTRTRKEGLEILFNEDNLTKGLKQADRQTILEDQILGFNSEVFLASCYFSQENLQMLTGLSDVDKTNMITNLLGFEEYDDLYDKINTKIKTLGFKSLDQDNNIKQANNEIDKNKAILSVTNNNIEKIQGQIKNTQLIIKKLNENKKALKLEELPEFEEIDYEKLIVKKTKERDKKQEIENKHNEQWNEELSNKRVFESQLSEFNRKLSLINSVGGVCDKCGSIIDEAHREGHIKELNDNMVAIQLNIDKCSLLIEKFKQEAVGLADARGDCDEELYQLNNKKNEQVKQIAERNMAQTRYESEISKLENELKTYRAQIIQYTEDIDDTKLKVVKVNEIIITLTKQIKEFEDNIVVINTNIDILEFWKEAFSPRGIKAVLLDRFCNDFNKIINQYMATISNNMSVIINPTATTKAGEARNKINLDILLKGINCKYISLSGGEKRRIDTALCLSLNKWVSNKYGVEHGLLGILILDELFSYLDREGEENIATLLYNEGMNKTIFVISHTPSLESFAEIVWTVLKQEGITKLL